MECSGSFCRFGENNGDSGIGMFDTRT